MAAMDRSKDLQFGGDRVFMSNGWPISFRSAGLIAARNVLDFERRLSEHLGHPVACLKLSPTDDGGCEGTLLHPDSVLVKENSSKNSTFPTDGSLVAGLWDGSDASDLYELLLAGGFVGLLSAGQITPESSFFALRSKRLSLAELRKAKLGFKESRRYSYFRDDGGRGILCVDGGVVVCRDTPAMIAGMKFFRGMMGMYHSIEQHAEALGSLGCELKLEAYREDR